MRIDAATRVPAIADPRQAQRQCAPYASSYGGIPEIIRCCENILPVDFRDDGAFVASSVASSIIQRNTVIWGGARGVAETNYTGASSCKLERSYAGLAESW